MKKFGKERFEKKQARVNPENVRMQKGQVILEKTRNTWPN
jgi:hypothetical protein